MGRKRRKIPKLRPYTLYANIFAATGLSPANDNGLADPYVRVSLAGVTERTQTIEASLNPMWYALPRAHLRHSRAHHGAIVHAHPACKGPVRRQGRHIPACMCSSRRPPPPLPSPPFPSLRYQQLALKVYLPGELTFASKVSVCVYDAGAAFGLSALQDLAPSDTVMGRTLAPSGPYTKNVSVFYNKYLRC